MDEPLIVSFDPPRLESAGPLLIAGLRRHYALSQDMSDIIRRINGQWHSFLSRSVGIPGRTGKTAYGVCFRVFDGAVGFDYLAGVEVSGTAGLPDDFDTVTIPVLRYAVFLHRLHVSKLRDTFHTIFGKSLPDAGLAPADGSTGAPEFVERYGEAFDPQTGMGGLEVLIPLME